MALQEQFAATPLLRDEQLTCASMLQNADDARLLLMPTHHIAPGHGGPDELPVHLPPPHAPGTTLPVILQMFHGHTLAECQADEDTIHRFMLNQKENQARMLLFMQQVFLLLCASLHPAKADRRVSRSRPTARLPL